MTGTYDETQIHVTTPLLKFNNSAKPFNGEHCNGHTRNKFPHHSSSCQHSFLFILFEADIETVLIYNFY